MLLYHGSNIEVAKPRLVYQSRGLDFGAGFYLTSSEEQAVRFSEIVYNRRKAGLPIVNIYNFDMDVADKTLSILKFDIPDADWLNYVVKNRLKTYQVERHDIIMGAVANDDVMPTIQAYVGGFLNEEAALVTLKTKKLVDQICVKTEKAMSLLNFVRAYKSGGF